MKKREKGIKKNKYEIARHIAELPWKELEGLLVHLPLFFYMAFENQKYIFICGDTLHYVDLLKLCPPGPFLSSHYLQCRRKST